MEFFKASDKEMALPENIIFEFLHEKNTKNAGTRIPKMHIYLVYDNEIIVAFMFQHFKMNIPTILCGFMPCLSQIPSTLTTQISATSGLSNENYCGLN